MLEVVGMEIVSEIVSSEVLREIGGGGANNRPRCRCFHATLVEGGYLNSKITVQCQGPVDRGFRKANWVPNRLNPGVSENRQPSIS